ncbi:MAG: hypothetical protein CM15mP74_33630 [Halieaceae bacterium]|nr:MAG: hypothetical protein CM15mP74_33630 [Halieaceae bacterium]
MNIEDYTCIKVDRPIERVNRITLNRPDKRNALSDQLRRELFTELTRVDTDDDINLTIIRGNEQCFSAGYDLSEPKEFSENYPFFTSEGLGAWPRQVTEGCFRIWDLAKPVIGQVSGHAWRVVLNWRSPVTWCSSPTTPTLATRPCAH